MEGWDSQDNQQEEQITGINVTPLVDTALVLLLVFMVATPVLMNQAVRVKLPKVAHAKPAMISTVAVTLKKDGQLYFNGKKTDYRELREKITQRLAEQEQLNEQEPEKKHKLQAIIAADAEVPHGDVMHLVDVVKDVGVKEFAFNIKKVDEVPPP